MSGEHRSKKKRDHNSLQCELGLPVTIHASLMYLHVTANDCNLNHDPENNTGYLRVLLMADLCKMLTWKKNTLEHEFEQKGQKQEQKFDHGKAKLNKDDIKLIHVLGRLNWLDFVQRRAYLLQFPALRTVSEKRKIMRRGKTLSVNLMRSVNTVLIQENLTGNPWQNVFCYISTHVPISVFHPFHVPSIFIPYSFHIHSLSVLFCSVPVLSAIHW